MKKNSLVNTHNSSLDCIRIAATILVVLNHSVESIYQLNISYIEALPMHVKWFCFGGFTLGRIGVPLFLILSGYLLLSREYDYEKTTAFYKKNVASLLITWEIWILIYSIFLSWFYQTPFDFATYVRRALFLQHAGMSHSWYMPMLIGVYMFIPLVSGVIRRLPDKLILFLMAVTFAYCFLVPSINIFLKINDSVQLSSQLDLNYSGEVYGFYLLLGYFTRKWNGKISKLLSIPIYYLLSCMAVLGLFFLSIYAQIFLYSSGVQYNIWYTFFSLPIIGFLLFSIISHWNCERFKTVLYCFSSHSFGVYLLHRPIQMVMLRAIGDVADKSTEIIIITMIIVVICYLVTFAASKIPYVGKWVFLNKSSK